MTTTDTPPGMIRMGHRFVPISKPFGSAKAITRKLLIALSYYEGDRGASEELALLIASLERVRNHEADFMLMRRADARDMNPAVVGKLAEKFDVVHKHACRRTDARGYPMGPNQMFGDLVSLMAHTPPFSTSYYAFLNLETDCVPTRPGWIGELIAAWNGRSAEVAALGFIHNDPVEHLNGVAIWSSDILRKIPALIGASPQYAYDIWHSKRILPHAAPTDLIAFSYRQATVADGAPFTAANGTSPALYHGVKDGSARAAVKARHVTFTEVIKPNPKAENLSAAEVAAEILPATISVGSLTTFSEAAADAAKAAAFPEVSAALVAEVFPENAAVATGLPDVPPKRQTVYTYAHKHAGVNKAEFEAILEAWKTGWTTRGWNPVVLGLRDAAKHPRFEEFQAAIEKLPCATTRPTVTHGFNRWLALDSVGGGLMVGNDVLPADFTPANCVLSGKTAVVVDGVGIFFAKEPASNFVQTIISYDAQPADLLNGKPHVTDYTVAKTILRDLAADFRVVRFDNLPPNERKSVAMQKFLRGE